MGRIFIHLSASSSSAGYFVCSCLAYCLRIGLVSVVLRHTLGRLAYLTYRSVPLSASFTYIYLLVFRDIVFFKEMGSRYLLILLYSCEAQVEFIFCYLG